jgi:hypothetical protein
MESRFQALEITVNSAKAHTKGRPSGGRSRQHCSLSLGEGKPHILGLGFHPSELNR